jgi:hypothetical protein
MLNVIIMIGVILLSDNMLSVVMLSVIKGWSFTLVLL